MLSKMEQLRADWLSLVVDGPMHAPKFASHIRHSARVLEEMRPYMPQPPTVGAPAPQLAHVPQPAAVPVSRPHHVQGMLFGLDAPAAHSRYMGAHPCCSRTQEEAQCSIILRLRRQQPRHGPPRRCHPAKSAACPHPSRRPPGQPLLTGHREQPRPLQPMQDAAQQLRHLAQTMRPGWWHPPGPLRGSGRCTGPKQWHRCAPDAASLLHEQQQYHAHRPSGIFSLLRHESHTLCCYEDQSCSWRTSQEGSLWAALPGAADALPPHIMAALDAHFAAPKGPTVKAPLTRSPAAALRVIGLTRANNISIMLTRFGGFGGDALRIRAAVLSWALADAELLSLLTQVPTRAHSQVSTQNGPLAPSGCQTLCPLQKRLLILHACMRGRWRPPRTRRRGCRRGWARQGTPPRACPRPSASWPP